MLLLRPYYLAFRNRSRGRLASRQSLGRDLLVIGITLIIMLSIYKGFSLILRAFDQDPLFQQIIPAKIIELICYAFFILLTISNSISAIGNVYTAPNMNLFLSAPVHPFRLYFAKLLETLIETSFMFVVFLLPVGLAYVNTLQLSWAFIVAGALVSIPFLFIPAGLSFVFGTAFVRFASFVWKRGYFLFLSIIGTAIWVVFSLVSLLNQMQGQRSSAKALAEVLGLFDNPNPIWLPSRWTADLVSYFVTGGVESGALKAVMLVTSAVGAVALGYLVYDLFCLSVRSIAGTYQRSEDELRGVVQQNNIDFVRGSIEFLYTKLPLEDQLRAIIIKDLTSLARDRAQALHMLMYLGIASVYLVLVKFSSAALSLAPVAMEAWWAFLASVNLLFTGFIITAMMTRLVYPSISLEGRAFWILLVSPVDLQRVILAKYFCWLPVCIIMSITLVSAGVVAILPGIPLVLTSLFVGVCMSIGCTGLAIGIGAVFASFEWESPNQISAGFGTLFLLVASLILVVMTLVPASALSFITVIPTLRTKIGIGTSYSIVAASIFAILLLNIWVSVVARRKGAKALLAGAYENR